MPGSSLTPVITSPVAPYRFSGFTTSNYDATANTINLGNTHNFATADPIWQTVDNSTGTAANGGIVLYQKYFVISINSTTIKLATTLENAINGVAFDFSAPTSAGASSATFAKFPGLPANVAPSIHQAYSRSNIVFNSSIPVEINFTVPAFTPIAIDSNNWHNPITCVLRQPTTNKYWGAIMAVRNFLSAYNGTGINANNAFQRFDIFQTAFSSGHNQKYVITPSRTIECWYGTVGSTMTLYYTTTVLDADTPLVLEFGSSFSFAKVQDCTIKYL